MRSHSIALAVSTIIASQLLSFVAIHAHAQGSHEIMMLIGRKGRDVCEVWSEKSDDGNWGGQAQESAPVACEGGLVTAIRTTQSESAQALAAFHARQVTLSLSSVVAQAEVVEEVRYVPLSGNAQLDVEAVQNEIVSIHEMFAAQDQEAAMTSSSYAFMSPVSIGVLLDEPVTHALPLAADCEQGPEKQQRKVHTKWYSDSARADLRAYITYKRLTCKHWRIKEVRVRVLQPPYNDEKLWLWTFSYKDVYRSMGDQP
jgi:hypothetical protein